MTDTIYKKTCLNVDCPERKRGECMADTNKDDELDKDLKLLWDKLVLRSNQDIELIKDFVTQYGIQERIDALTELKQSYHDNIVSDDRMDLEIDEALTAPKDKETK